MIVVISSGDNDAFATIAPLTMAYTGRFTVEGDSFVTAIDAASIPAWVGTPQTRQFVIDGDRLTIRTASGPHPAFPGVDVVGLLEWRREG
jgi:hypothetical protein